MAYFYIQQSPFSFYMSILSCPLLSSLFHKYINVESIQAGFFLLMFQIGTFQGEETILSV